MSPVPQHRVGRRRSTTWDHISSVAIDLFAARGFDEVSVDDVAEAAGIARRTLFRYYPSKNAIPWGDFDAHLDHIRELLADLDPDVAISDASAHGIVGVQHASTKRRRPAPATDAGDPGDGGAAGLLDDHVCGLARRRRRIRRARRLACEARRPGRPRRWPGRCWGWHSRPTNTGWPTSRCHWPMRSAMPSTWSGRPGRSGPPPPDLTVPAADQKSRNRASEFGAGRRR